MTLVIALDGPAASGKGTLARRLAAAFDLAYLDTGGLYRAVAAKLLAEAGDPEDREAAATAAETLAPADLQRPDLRSQAVGSAASVVAAQPRVRRALLEFQRGFAAQPPEGRAGAVLDGRDIGTVVCPDADVKIYVVASPEVRAERRHRELIDRGEPSIYPQVLAEIRERDARDSVRSTAPLKPADDAVLLDTSELDIEAAFRAAQRIVAETLAAAKAE
ncbi:(d)CMP kinase [Algihabitans albus]|uniref:(d)CMP kinase n=1 Tax=Algihabitans albus TaxID=2164067 RepID=UPI000E5CD448|nr:(d)CMP kinase [Algihabitans albus]